MTTTTRVLVLALVCGAASVARATADADDAAAPPVAPAAAQPAADAPTGFKARVTLVNGRAFSGVVRIEGTWEKKDQHGAWVACGKDDAGAGVRLWYVGGREGFLVVTGPDVKSVENLGAVDGADVRKQAEGAAAAEKKALEEREQLRKARDEKKRAEAAAAAKAKSADAAKKEGEAATAKAASDLLDKFPPSQWSAQRRDDIEKKNLLDHIEPTPEEREFLKSYDSWAKALALEQAAAEKASDGAGKPEEKPAGGK